MAVELATAYISLVPSAKGMAAKLEAELGGLDDVADKVGGEAGDSYSGKFLDVAKTGFLAGVAVVGAALTKGLLDAIDTEQVNDKLAAQLGATGDYAEDLGKISGELYADAYGESLGEVNEALRNVLQQGLLPEDATDDQIKAMTAKVMDLAKTFDQDLGGVTSAVSQLLRTDMADSADEALDILTRGFQQGVNVQDDYLETLREYPTQFRKLGIDADTATGIMSQGLRAGARDADIVADALKEFSIRAVDGSELTAEGFAALGLSGEEMSAAIAKGGPEAAAALDLTLDRLRTMADPAARAQTAVALFGTQAEDLGGALDAIDPSTAVQGLGNVAGAAERMGDTLNDNAGARIEAFKRERLQDLSTFVGDTVLPRLEELGDWAGSVDWAGWGADIQAGLHPVRTAMGGLFDDLQVGWGEVTDWFLVHSADFSEAVLHITNVVTGIWDIFGGTVLRIVSDYFRYIGETITNVITAVQAVIELVLAVINGDWDEAWQAVRDLTGALWDQIFNTIRFFTDMILGVLRLAWDAISFGFSWLWSNVAEFVNKAWDTIYAKVVGAGAAVVQAAGDFTGSVLGVIGSIPGKVGEVLATLADTAKKPFEALGDAIAKAWNDTIGGFGFDIPDIPGIPGRGTKIEIPEMHSGGLVPGRPGREVLTILEAGERVLSRGDVARMGASSAPVHGAAGAGGPVVGNLQVTTMTNATADETVAAINAKLGWALTTRRDR